MVKGIGTKSKKRGNARLKKQMRIRATIFAVAKQ